MPADQDITYFGKTNHRNQGVPFGIRRRDRRSHFYVCGKTGVGKSFLLRTMIEQDIRNGEGCALFDPHGQLAEEVSTLVPEHRQQDLFYVNPADPSSPFRFNPFGHVPPEKRALAAEGLVETFKKIWSEDWGPRLEHLLRNVAHTLPATPGSTFADIPRLLADRTFRLGIVSDLPDEIVRSFWRDEFERYSPGFKSVVIAPLQNKIGALLTDPVLRSFLTTSGQLLDLRQIMDERKILVVNLDKGRMGEGPSTLLGSLLLSHIALTGLSRSEKPEEKRKDFWVYLDEFQSFTTLSIANMLSELRKYRVGLLLAHQHLSQLDSSIRDAVFGNVGTMVSFRVGAADAQYLAREFAPRFSGEDLVNLPRYHVYVRMLLEGEIAPPFSGTTITEVPTGK